MVVSYDCAASGRTPHSFFFVFASCSLSCSLSVSVCVFFFIFVFFSIVFVWSALFIVVSFRWCFRMSMTVGNLSLTHLAPCVSVGLWRTSLAAPLRRLFVVARGFVCICCRSVIWVILCPVPLSLLSYSSLRLVRLICPLVVVRRCLSLLVPWVPLWHVQSSVSPW